MNSCKVSYLEERGDGERGDAAVDVGDQVLQVQVTCSHGRGVFHRHLGDERWDDGLDI